MKKLIKFALFLGLIFAIQMLCRKATDDFALELIKQPLEKGVEQTVDPEISAILAKPFHYLSSGGQCFVFASEDGKYVLKVFKQHHLRLPSWIAAISPDFLKKKFERKEQELLMSCKIAASELAEETGVVFLHLEDSPETPSQITLIDKLHIAHKVPSSSLPFVLQKRATPLMQKLGQLKPEEAKELIDHLALLVEHRCDKGIADNDPFLDRNFGLIENDVVEYDIGPYSYDPMLKYPEHKRRELYFTLTAFQRRLDKNYPELSAYLEQAHIQKLLHE